MRRLEGAAARLGGDTAPIPGVPGDDDTAESVEVDEAAG